MIKRRVAITFAAKKIMNDLGIRDSYSRFYNYLIPSPISFSFAKQNQLIPLLDGLLS
jgi:hypothetical protein